MPNVSSEKLLKLHLEAAVARRVAIRGLDPQTIDDFARRAVESGRFRIGVESGELLGGGEFAVDEFISELEQDEERNGHLFQTASETRKESPDGKLKSEDARVAAMSPLQKLAYANQQSAAKRAS